jgi:hypothetical protein
MVISLSSYLLAASLVSMGRINYWLNSARSVMQSAVSPSTREQLREIREHCVPTGFAQA